MIGKPAHRANGLGKQGLQAREDGLECGALGGILVPAVLHESAVACWHVSGHLGLVPREYLEQHLHMSRLCQSMHALLLPIEAAKTLLQIIDALMRQAPPATLPAWMIRSLHPRVSGLAGRAKQAHYLLTMVPRYASVQSSGYMAHLVRRKVFVDGLPAPQLQRDHGEAVHICGHRQVPCLQHLRRHVCDSACIMQSSPQGLVSYLEGRLHGESQ